MALLDDILIWSEDLRAWQRDALRRLFLGHALTQTDLSELLALVKEEHGDGAHASVRPIFLSEEHVASSGTGGDVHLIRLENLQNVNRFPPGRTVNFEPDRLNVFFGENGAGKSGYGRVLKNACRARHRQPVLPDSFDPTRPRPTPTAEITYIHDGNPAKVTWTQGRPTDPALGRIAVYDSACGTDYLAKEGASDYQPFGLPHLNRLVTAQRDLQAIVDQERGRVSQMPHAFADLHGDHDVGHFLENLGPDSDLETLRALATFTPEHHSRVEELARVLGAMNPEPEARSAERLAARLEAAATTAHTAQRCVGNRTLTEVQQRKQNDTGAKQAWALAQQRLHHRDSDDEQELLPGTGSDVWRSLFEAAEKFSLQHAYPEHAHPNLEEGAKCVLCQSLLDQDAKGRLARFSRFIEDEASKNAQDAKQRMEEAMLSIDQANLEPIDPPTLEDLAAADPELHAFANATSDIWRARRQWIQTAVDTNDWGIPIPRLIEGEALDVRLRAKANALRSHAAELRSALDPEAKRLLELERAALLARKSLAARIEEAEQHVTKAREYRNWSTCHSALNPRRISAKMTELAGKYVTNALAEAMNSELQGLGYRRKVEPQITGRTDDGQTMVALRIKDALDGANQVLSEGEQRAMALALFLAEARLQADSSTLVFDDPSTSLDHHHRRQMAVHLAALATERHVIVLTHDAVFLTEISRAVSVSEQPVAYQTVTWEGARPGFVAAGLTWETMDSRARLVELEAVANSLAGHSGDYPDEATKERIKQGYTKLRGTIERAIREVFMNNTVRPFADDVSVDSFGAVIGHPPDEWTQLSTIYATCCEVTDAHDTNAAHQLPIPQAVELLAHIGEAKDLISKADTRRKAYENERGKKNKARKAPFAGRA